MKNSFTILLLLTILLLSNRILPQNFWEPTNLPVGGITALAVNSSDHVFAANSQTVFRSTDNGENWIEINNGLPTIFYPETFAINSNDNIFLGSSISVSGIYRSTDNGDNWVEINNGLTNTFVLALAVNSSDHIFAGTDGGIFKSTNNGNSWFKANNGLPTVQVNSFAINSSDHVFAGTSGEGAFRSTDEGNTWLEINNGITASYVISFAINSSNYIFASTEYGTDIIISTNNGDNWNNLLNNGLLNTHYGSLLINSSNHIYAGSDNSIAGIFRSTDNGENWVDINSGLTNKEIKALAINSNGYIFSGGGGGVFRSINSTTSLKFEDIIPYAFSLEQNYPNPFNPSTTIRYEIPEQSFVTLKVFDILGNEIATLVNQEKPAGSYEVEFNIYSDEGQNLVSGVYFYTISAGSFSSTKKMILLK